MYIYAIILSYYIIYPNTFLGNDAPVLSGPTTFYKYPNELRFVAITISDSDGHDITINVISSIPSGISLDLETDRIHWWGTNIGTYTLLLRLVDECGAETEVTLTFVVAACQCRNGGTCAPSELDGSNIGSPFCLCPIPFSGVLCEIGPDPTIGPPAPTPTTTTPTPAPYPHWGQWVPGGHVRNHVTKSY